MTGFCDIGKMLKKIKNIRRIQNALTAWNTTKIVCMCFNVLTMMPSNFGIDQLRSYNPG
jgi:ribosomal protein S8